MIWIYETVVGSNQASPFFSEAFFYKPEYKYFGFGKNYKIQYILRFLKKYLNLKKLWQKVFQLNTSMDPFKKTMKYEIYFEIYDKYYI